MLQMLETVPHFILPPINVEGKKLPERFEKRTKQQKVIKDRKYSAQETKRHKSTSTINYVNQEQEGPARQETIVVEIQHEGPHRQSQQTTVFPTREITVVNTTTKTFQKVANLLNTGAELSFVDAISGAEIDLPIIVETRLRLCTFGFEKAREKPLNKVSLKTWDAGDHSFPMRLFTHDKLVKPLVILTVPKKDVNFIHQRNPSVICGRTN
ncbi:unnamed protein product [Angiostrongylus costaricensis]|uniref:Peptidase A2 domain-containing protein n=1 Tax=Angiostrongylus costaricensis TaxID=334426 RepID=A0A0R3Q1P6_ANGCS|nr:unnamed protein product [Angiostrongylus costaricensis]